MKIGINNLYQIKQIQDITDASLTTVEIDETSEFYPFNGWSDTKILSYCYKDDGSSLSVYPYIDTNLIEKLEKSEETDKTLNDLIQLLADKGVLW